MCRAGKASQIDTDLGDEHLGGAAAHARDRLQPLHLWSKRAHTLSDLGVHPLQTDLQEVDVGQLLGDEESMMRAKLRSERLLELGDLLA